MSGWARLCAWVPTLVRSPLFAEPAFLAAGERQKVPSGNSSTLTPRQTARRSVICQNKEMFKVKGSSAFNDWGEAFEMNSNEDLPEALQFSFRRPLEILAMDFDPHDAVLENGYLKKSSPCAICGIGGIGKFRLALQMAMDIALGRRFLSWKTNGAGPATIKRRN